KWLTVERLEEHWAQARVEAEIVDAAKMKITTKNVAALSLKFDEKQEPFAQGNATVEIDGQAGVVGPRPRDGTRTVLLAKKGGKWAEATTLNDGQLHKQFGLQGPIDDAFLDRFVMVKPTGTPLHEKTGKWVEAEMAHAVEHWRRQFRGEAIVKADTEITDADIANSNLVLWGDPQSNKLIARILDRLPFGWSPDAITLDNRSSDARRFMP